MMKHRFDLLDQHLGNYKETNIYYGSNPKYFEDLISLLRDYPRFYFKKLEAKGNKHDGWNPRYKYLKDWIDFQLPILSDPFYSTTTKVYWILAGLTKFPICRVCKKQDNYIRRQASIFTVDPYPKSCCIECAHICEETKLKSSQTYARRMEEDPTYSERIIAKSRQTRYKKNGEGIWVTQETIEKRNATLERLVSEDPNFFKKKEAKRQATNIKNGHTPGWHNEEQMVKTRYKKNNGIWITPEQFESRRLSSLDKYGCEDPNQSDIVKQHKKQAFIDHYGVDHYWKTDESKHHMIDINEQRKEKEFETKKRNHSFKSSKAEQLCLKPLQDKFGANNIVQQYKSEVYPFRCDFYIKSMDLYIELNAYWMHGKKFFDANNEDDQRTLKLWEQRSISSKGYRQAIKTWTQLDPKKAATAIANHLHYLVFWSEQELLDWIASVKLENLQDPQ